MNANCPTRHAEADRRPSTGPCDSCGHKEGHLVPGGELICEACFYTFDPEADYIHGG